MTAKVTTEYTLGRSSKTRSIPKDGIIRDSGIYINQVVPGDKIVIKIVWNDQEELLNLIKNKK